MPPLRQVDNPFATVKFHFGILLSIIITAIPALGLEVQGIVTSKCQSYLGVTVNVEDHKIEIIEFDGGHRSIDADEVSSIAIFNIIENPFQNFKIDNESAEYLKSIYVSDTDSPQAIAFAVKFIENLVVFLSTDGKLHVHEMGEIFKIRPVPSSYRGRVATKQSKDVAFDFRDISGRCTNLNGKVAKDGVRPTRILGDQISISEYISSLEQGYAALESFQERTYLYAKPFLFEKKTRLGLMMAGNREESGINFPLYVQWSSGKPYRFQSHSVIGGQAHEILPNAEPVFTLRSDVKSHIFHGVFVGNVAGLPAGENVFLSNLTEDVFKKDVTVQPSFNYLAMMGGDYGPLSASVGFYFPTFGIRVMDEYREVLGSSLSYAFRVMWTKDNWRFRTIGSWSDFSSKQASNADVLLRSGINGTLTHPNSFKFQSLFLRSGLDLDLSDRWSVSADGIIVRGNYKEVVGAQGNNLDFSRFTLQGRVKATFGEYISLSAYLNLIQHNFDTFFNNQSIVKDQKENRFFGSLEFIF